MFELAELTGKHSTDAVFVQIFNGAGLEMNLNRAVLSAFGHVTQALDLLEDSVKEGDYDCLFKKIPLHTMPREKNKKRKSKKTKIIPSTTLSLLLPLQSTLRQSNQMARLDPIEIDSSEDESSEDEDTNPPAPKKQKVKAADNLEGFEEVEERRRSRSKNVETPKIVTPQRTIDERFDKLNYLCEKEKITEANCDIMQLRILEEELL